MIIVVKVVAVTLVVLFGIRFWMLIDDVQGLMKDKEVLDRERYTYHKNKLIDIVMEDCNGCEDCIREQLKSLNY